MKLHYNYTAVNISIQPAGYSCPLTFIIIRFYLFTNRRVRKSPNDFCSGNCMPSRVSLNSWKIIFQYLNQYGCI